MSSPAPGQTPVEPLEPLDRKPEHQSIPVIREEPLVETVREHTGTVRVRKIVREIAEPVPAHSVQEQVKVERKPFNQKVDAARDARQEAGVLIIPVYEERLVKQLFLIEEIHVTRHLQTASNAGEKTVSLRHEEVVVERFDAASQQWLIDPDHARTHP